MKTAKEKQPDCASQGVRFPFMTNEPTRRDRIEKTVIRILCVLGVICLAVAAVYEYRYYKAERQKAAQIQAQAEAQRAKYDAMEKHDYVLNTKSMKIHRPDCKYADEISEGNRAEVHGALQEYLDRGYSLCGACNPQ